MLPPPPRRPAKPTAALFVRIPTEQADRLNRAAAVLGRAKQDLVSSLLEQYVDPDSPGGLSALQAEAAPERPRPVIVDPAPSELVLGRHSFRPTWPPADAPEVLTLQQAAELLQVEPEVVQAMAERGELPARRLGCHWRLGRRALVQWLAAPGADRREADAITEPEPDDDDR